MPRERTVPEVVGALASRLGPILQVLGALSGLAAVFYAAGYIVAWDTLERANFKGTLSIRSEFYVGAGADFFVDMLVAPLLAPLVFLPLFLFLRILVPNAASRAAGATRAPAVAPAGRFSRWRVLSDWGRLAVLFAIMVLTYRAALDFDEFSTSAPVQRVVHHLLHVGEGNVAAGRAPLLFALMLPVAGALGYVVLRAEKVLPHVRRVDALRTLFTAAFIAYAAMIPVAYAKFVYDWHIVKVIAANPDANLWFARRVQDQGVFVRCDPQREIISYEMRPLDSKEPLQLETSWESFKKMRCHSFGRLTADDILQMAK